MVVWLYGFSFFFSSLGMDKAVEQYGIVLGIDEERTRTILRHLDQNVQSQNFFTTAFQWLEFCCVNKHTLVGEGTYGKIYTSNGYAYKEVVLDEDMEVALREVFLETFVQTVLHQDPVYGHRVCKVIAVYQSLRSVCVQMEYIPTNFYEGFSSFSMEKTLPVLLELSRTLAHFYDRYTFYHRDLHTGNVMFSGDEIKLIDFGMSCITLDNITYSLNLEIQFAPDYSCVSFDMVIFILSLLTHTKGKIDLDPEMFDFLHDMLVTQNGVNVYDLYKDSKHPHHEVYYWKIEGWDPDRRRDMLTSYHLLPHGMAKQLRMYL